MKQKIIRNEIDLKTWHDEFAKELARSKEPLTIIVKRATRTIRQNNSLFSSEAELYHKLNEAGYDFTAHVEDMKKTGLRVSWTKENMHQFFKKVAMELFRKDSSTKLTTVEIKEAWDVFSKNISDKTGIYVEWHSNEPPMLREFDYLDLRGQNEK